MIPTQNRFEPLKSLYDKKSENYSPISMFSKNTSINRRHFLKKYIGYFDFCQTFLSEYLRKYIKVESHCVHKVKRTTLHSCSR